jgi:hypothetical protein
MDWHRLFGLILTDFFSNSPFIVEYNLANQVPLEEHQPGVYRCRRGTDEIRVVVLRQLPQVDHNALWHLFSAVPAQVGYAAQHYRPRSEQTSTLLDQLFEGYLREGVAMPYTMEDFRHDYLKEHISQLTFEERLEGVPVEERLKGVPAEERLKGLSAKEIEDLLKRLTNGPSAAPE